MLSDYLLSLIIWLPIVGGLVVLLLGQHLMLVRVLACTIASAVFLLTIKLLIDFDSSSHLMQFVEYQTWIKTFDINYYLGIDGIALPLILLTAFAVLLVIVAAWSVTRLAQYMAAFLIMEGLMIGVFSALDGILFYIFWEASLIPMLLIIGIWGGEQRVYAAIKFFLYTFLGSVLMLLSFIYMYNVGGSFAILDFHHLPLTQLEQNLIFWALFLAFAVKVPMFPVHTWLPDAHVQAPTGGSVILAAIMLKMGGYGFFRFSLPIVPDAASVFAIAVIALSLIAIVYIGFIALVQQDMKKLIAYSSVSHMGFVTLGVFALFLMVEQKDYALLGISGGYVQMISHGFISAAMFIIVGVLYDRMKTKLIKDYGGVANQMPVFMFFVVLFAMANAGLPATSGFVGEFMVILAVMKANFWLALTAASTLIVGAAYTLWMVKRVFWGPIVNENVATLTDINGREFFVLLTLAIAVLVFGLYPDLLLDICRVSIDHLFNQAVVSKL